jgi:hypothetical protein
MPASKNAAAAALPAVTPDAKGGIRDGASRRNRRPVHGGPDQQIMR